MDKGQGKNFYSKNLREYPSDQSSILKKLKSTPTLNVDLRVHSSRPLSEFHSAIYIYKLIIFKIQPVDPVFVE